MRVVRILLVLVVVLFFGNSSAQNTDRYWVFGDSAGIDWSTNPPSKFTTQVKQWRSSASIGNVNGLVAYSIRSDNFVPVNGKVWNRFHRQMQNGNYIYGGGWYHERLFLPAPGSDSLLYLLSCGVTISGPYGLYYSLIDLKANNDSGAVIQKNVPLNSYPAFDALMAVQHGNGRDWWVFFRRASLSTSASNTFYKYLITPTGIAGPDTQSIGAITYINSYRYFFQTTEVNWVV